MAACALIAGVLQDLKCSFVAACDAFKAHILSACDMAAQTPKAKDRKPIWFVKPKAYAGAMAKRERPVLTSAWRMCPST